MAILTELQDPRIQDVTVTFVEVSPDMRQAKVHVSIMGDEAKQKLSLKGLQNAAGFLQQMVGNRIETRYIPKLTFVIDRGVKNALEVARILNEVLPKDRAPADAEQPLREAADSVASSGEAEHDNAKAAELKAEEFGGDEIPYDDDELPGDDFDDEFDEDQNDEEELDDDESDEDELDDDEPPRT